MRKVGSTPARGGPSDAEMRHYEGLIFKTAQMYASVIEEDPEDIRQILRIKVWQGLVAYDEARSRMSRDRFVFMVLTNQVKDLKKRKRRGELHIEDVVADHGLGFQSRDSFDERYLSSSHDETFGDVEDDDLVVPSTLTQTERRIVAFLYRDYKQTEAARRLGLGEREMERAMRSIRAKLADWKPTGEAPPVRERQAA